MHIDPKAQLKSYERHTWRDGRGVPKLSKFTFLMANPAQKPTTAPTLRPLKKSASILRSSKSFAKCEENVASDLSGCSFAFGLNKRKMVGEACHGDISCEKFRSGIQHRYWFD